MKGLLLAEKPSVMRAIEEVYKSNRSAFPDTLEFGAFHGHLMALNPPEAYDPAWADRRNNAILPIIPSSFSYYAEDKKSVDMLMAKIRSGHYDFLVNACDAGREGEHIFWSFYETMGLTIPVKRFWCSSVTKPALKNALGKLQDPNLYDGMRQASKFRAQFDWLVGMNFTRAASNSMGEFVPIGRVQSPTLKLIVDRELEIRNFQSQDFYEVKAQVSVGGGDEVSFVHLVAPDHKETRFSADDKAAADAVAEAVKTSPNGTVLEVKEEIKTIEAPTLYSLAELEKDANKYFKYSPKKTDGIAQKLYESGYITYPRAESRFLPKDMIPEIPNHLASLNVVPELAPYVMKITQKEIGAMLAKGYINDAGVTDHHAIIPTDSAPVWTSLSKDEQRLYSLIGKSFLAIFLPPYQCVKSSVIIDINGNWFKAAGRREVQKGYGALYPSKKTKDTLLPACRKGDPVLVKNASVVKGTTKPPQRYSPKSIIEAMQHAGNNLSDAAMRKVLRESAGLGTAASRSEILQKLEDRGLVEIRGNNYYALDKGVHIIENIGGRGFVSPMLTAQWEEKLRSIEKGSYTGNFRAEMEAYVRNETDYLLSNLKGTGSTPIGTCPLCNGRIYARGNAFCCENNKKDGSNVCPVWLPKALGGYTMTVDDITALLSMKKIGPINLVKKNKDQWRVYIYLDKDGAMQLESCERPSVGICPCCGARMISMDKAYVCEKRKRDDPASCQCWFPKTVGGYTFNESDIKAILAMKSTEPHTILTKAQKKWTVSFRMSEETFELVIESAEERKIVGKCFLCGKPVYAAEKSYYCRGNSDKSCNFSFPKVIKGAVIREEDISAMLAGKRTKPITFTWASGRTGRAILSFATDGKLIWDFPDAN